MHNHEHRLELRACGEGAVSEARGISELSGLRSTSALRQNLRAKLPSRGSHTLTNNLSPRPFSSHSKPVAVSSIAAAMGGVQDREG